MSTTNTAEHTQARERVLDAAIAAGKIMPSRRAHFAALYDTNPAYASDLIAKLAAGIPPAQQEALAAARSDAYDQSWLSPAERRRIGAAHSDAHVHRIHD